MRFFIPSRRFTQLAAPLFSLLPSLTLGSSNRVVTSWNRMPFLGKSGMARMDAPTAARRSSVRGGIGEGRGGEGEKKKEGERANCFRV